MAARLNPTQDARFYVYAIMDGPVCLYVGKGCGPRAKVSARKHGGTAEVLATFKSEDEAFSRERELIAELVPENNLCAGGNGGRSVPVAPDAMPKDLQGIVTEGQWRRELREESAKQAVIQRNGTRRYAAQILCRKLNEANCEIWGVSKVDMSRLREVAHG